MSIHSFTAREEPPDSGTALLCIPDQPQDLVELVVTRLFPWPTQGQTFLARFKERAATERSIIPGLEPGDVVICTKSIAKLAKALGLAYDTTQKYVAIFKALGMLQKRTFMGQIAFILSLGIYLPPKQLEANLEYLLQRSQTKKSRIKFHSLVRDVKERCLVYGLINQEWTSALRQLQALLQPPEKGLSRRTLEQRLIQAQHLVSTMLAQVMTRRLLTGDTSLAEDLPLPKASADSNARRWEGKSPRQAPTKRGCNQLRPPNLPGSPIRIDSLPPDHSSESPQAGRTGRFEREKPVPNLPQPLNRVDSIPSRPEE